MTTGTVSVERRGHVLLMGLDRAAKRNAFDLPLWDALCDAYAELDRDPSFASACCTPRATTSRAASICRSGAPTFSSGAWHDQSRRHSIRSASPARACPSRSSSAVQGMCLTIGIELMLATDIRIAARDTRFGQIEIKRGIYPVGGATLRFPREVGWANAMRWLLTGDEFDAAEALRIGLVQEVVEPGEQLARAVAIADTIAAQAPLGVYATLASSRAAIPAAEGAAGQRLMPDLQPIMKSADVQEGLRAFMERRPGTFEGR